MFCVCQCSANVTVAKLVTGHISESLHVPSKTVFSVSPICSDTVLHIF